MTPEQEAKLNEVFEWMQARKVQQISHPLDLASKATLSAATLSGTGSANDKDTIALTGDAQNIEVPANPSGTVILEIEGSLHEFLVK